MMWFLSSRQCILPTTAATTLLGWAPTTTSVTVLTTHQSILGSPRYWSSSVLSSFSSSSSSFHTAAFSAVESHRFRSRRGEIVQGGVASLLSSSSSSSPLRCDIRGASPLSRATTTIARRTMSTDNNDSSNSNNDMESTFWREYIQQHDLHGCNVLGAIQTLRQADVVCFDVDSTVITEEGIDVLAESLGNGAAVAELTKQAMQGGMKFQDALKMRLDLLQPSKHDIATCQQQHPLELTPGVADLIRTLQQRGVVIFLVSGGFRVMIEPVAAALGIGMDCIVANTLLFHPETGAYQGFDPTEPTSHDMGKARALEQIRQRLLAKNNSNSLKQQQPSRDDIIMVMMGDGATDAQAKPPATAFIGFGGIAVRPAVQAVADWFVTDMNEVVQVLVTTPAAAATK